jgi:hypothetical protein
MIGDLKRRFLDDRLLTWAVVGVILLGAAVLGLQASRLVLVLVVAAIAGVFLLRWPSLGFMAMVPIALLLPVQIGTGTEVVLNLATLLVPALLALWVLDMARRRELTLVPSRTTRPLILFLLAGLFSLLAGIALWDALVPRSSSFVLVQLAQWAIYAFSGGAFLLTGNVLQDELALQRLTFFFLLVAGGTAMALVIAGGGTLIANGLVTVALNRSSFWMLLAALALGQLLFNDELSGGWRLFLAATLAAVLVYAFFQERATASHWVGVATVTAALIWLRWPRLRLPVAMLVVVLLGTGIVTTAIYSFAGGDAEWQESGVSRLSLIRRVLEVTMHNPLTGLGPAAYRAYARMRPLASGGAFWINPNVSSHNNYVDLFSHGGLLGLGLFAWFVVELGRLGVRLRYQFRQGFASGYVNAALGIGAGSLVIMVFADWILPFVYNIGFPGFQASVLVWMFLGGLVTLEQVSNKREGKEATGA